MNSSDLEATTVPPDGKPLESQPQWRQDFPVDWSRDEYISRRDFTKFMVLTSLSFSFGQFWIVLQNFLRQNARVPEAVAIARVDEIPVGGSVIFRYPDEEAPRILVRLGENDFVAYDQQCTHLLCPVLPEPEHNVLHCPCHEGYFDIRSGRPIAGPPRRPLPRVTLDIRNGIIYATGITREVS